MERYRWAEVGHYTDFIIDDDDLRLPHSSQNKYRQKRCNLDPALTCLIRPLFIIIMSITVDQNPSCTGLQTSCHLIFRVSTSLLVSGLWRKGFKLGQRDFNVYKYFNISKSTRTRSACTVSKCITYNQCLRSTNILDDVLYILFHFHVP